MQNQQHRTSTSNCEKKMLVFFVLYTRKFLVNLFIPLKPSLPTGFVSHAAEDILTTVHEHHKSAQMLNY